MINISISLLNERLIFTKILIPRQAPATIKHINRKIDNEDVINLLNISNIKDINIINSIIIKNIRQFDRASIIFNTDINTKNTIS